MHFVIGGYGRVGRYLAHELEAEGHTVSVIDRNPRTFEELDDIRGSKFVGEVFDRDTLEAAGIRRAEGFAAVTSGDNSNIVGARIARENFGVRSVLARIYDPRRAELYRELDIRTISSVEWASARFLRLLTNPLTESEYQFGGGEVEMIEVTAGPALAGRELGAFEKAGAFRVASLVREHKAFVAQPHLVLAEGDRLYIIVHKGVLPELKAALGLEQV